MVNFLILTIITLFFYKRTVYYGYLIDDLEVAGHDKSGKWWLDLWYQVRGHAYFNPRVEHTITLLIHTLNVNLIYLALGRTPVALMAALLFAVNPVNTQASVWLSGKVYALAATMILLGLWLKPLFPALYLAGYYFSLNVLLTPLLFLFLQPTWFVALVIILPIAFRKRLIQEPKRRYDGSTHWMQEISFRKLIILVKSLGYYFRLCLFPTKLGMCHQYLHVFGLSKKETEKWYSLDRYFWLGIGVLATTAIGVVMKWQITGLFWFVVLMLQWCNFLMLNHPICERYTYLANIGLMYMVATILSNVPHGTYLFFILVTYYATRLWYFLPAYSNNLAYFVSNTDNFHNAALGWNQVGLEQIAFGKPMAAIDTFMEGLMYRPNDFRLNYNTANLLQGMGRYADAVPYVNKAEYALDPHNNYELWRNHIDIIKNNIRKNGIVLN